MAASRHVGIGATKVRRVVIDARRQRDNGVARITRLLISALSGTGYDLVLLGPRGTLNDQFPELVAVEYGAPLLSTEDLHGLDGILRDLDADCFVAPQFYNSPWTKCPQVRLLHDTFPLEKSAVLTSSASAERAFGSSELASAYEAIVGAPYTGSSDAAAKAYRKYYELTAEAASILLTVSHQSRADILKHFPAVAGKLRLLPLFADPAIVDDQAPLDNRGIDLLHVSKFEPRKNQLALISAWRRVWQARPTLTACIVGSPSPLFPDYAERVLREIERAKVEGWLVHEANVDDARLRTIYASSSVSCSVSTAEGYGLPALEAMSNGCAVIALRGTAIEEVGGEFIIYPDNSVEGISSTIESLLSLPELRLRIAHAARRQAGRMNIEATKAALTLAINDAIAFDPSSSVAFRAGGLRKVPDA